MARRKVKTTRLEIIQCATTMFLEQGYTESSMKQIADALDLAPGNLTYYFPTKEHMLAVLTDMMCEFQRRMMEQEAGEGMSSIMSICLELAAMAAICEMNEVAADFYLSAYRSPMCMDIIRRNDMLRAIAVFRSTCSKWSEEHFAEAAALVSGLEYGTLLKAGKTVSMEIRIAGALDGILSIYTIPPDVRKLKIRKVLDTDYRMLANRVLADFKSFVSESNEQALEALLRAEEAQCANPVRSKLIREDLI